MTRARLACRLAPGLAAACAPYLVTVPTGPARSTATPVSVEYPPPPARVEDVFVAHGAGLRCAWRDGYWDWVGKRWEWTPGAPLRSKPGCHWVPPRLERGPKGLGFFRPEWVADEAGEGAPRDCTPEACTAGSASGS